VDISRIFKNAGAYKMNFIKPFLLASVCLVVSPAWAQYTHLFTNLEASATITKAIALPNRETLLAGTDGSNVFFRRLDIAGGTLWETLVDGDVVCDVVVDPNGEVYASVYDNDGSPTLETRGLDAATGAVRWTNSVAVIADAGASLATAKVGNSVLLYSITTVQGAGSDVLARRINPNTGAQIWANQMDDSGLNDRAGDVTASPGGAPFFAMTMEAANGGVPMYTPTVKRLQGGNGAVTWSKWFNQVEVSEGPATRLTDIFMLSDVFVGVIGFGENDLIGYGSGAGVGRHLDRILNPNTGATVGTAPTGGTSAPRSYGVTSSGEYFASYESQGNAAVKFASRQLWRTVYADSASLYDVSVLGVNASNRPVILRTSKDGSETGVIRFSDRFYSEFVPIRNGADAMLPGEFRHGFVDGNDFLIFNSNEVRRYRESVRASDDSFNLPFATQMVQGPGAILVNDNGFAGGTIHLTMPPAHGTLELNQDGSFVYTKGGTFTGTDEFRYELRRDGDVSEAIVRIGDLKITSVTFSNHPVIGGERTDGQVTFSHVPFPGSLQIVENSPNVVTHWSNAYFIPTSNVVNFLVTTKPVASASAIAITARMHGTAKTGVLTLYPGAVVDLTFSKSPVVGGEVLTGTVHLNAPAPVERTIDLTALDPEAILNVASVTIPVGATSADFTIKTAFASRDTNAEIRARAQHAELDYGSVVSRALEIKARPRVTSLVGPAVMSGGATANFSVNLDKVTPYNYKVNLSSSGTITPPPFVTVSSGNSGKSFPLTADSVASSTTVTLTATTGGTSVTRVVQVNP